MKTSEQYIQKLAEGFELPIEKVALVWSTVDYCNIVSQENMYNYVGDLLVDLFPK